MSRMGLALAVAGDVPPVLWRPMVQIASWVVALRPPRPLRQWQLNACVVTGTMPGRRDTARAAASWARNLFESTQLEHWSHEDIRASILVDDEDRARLLVAHREGGAVIALPHMASWDLAGAWACLEGMPVATVAEELEESEFAYFTRVRERLGMRIHGHRTPHILSLLEADARDGRLVCLVGDRNFGRGGVPVSWPTATGAVRVRMPGGAAHLSLTTGATLLGVACRYEGRRMRLVVSQPIAGGDVAGRTQGLADFFAAQVQQDVVDWHVLVRFFPGVVAR